MTLRAVTPCLDMGFSMLKLVRPRVKHGVTVGGVHGVTVGSVWVTVGSVWVTVGACGDSEAKRSCWYTASKIIDNIKHISCKHE